MDMMHNPAFVSVVLIGVLAAFVVMYVVMRAAAGRVESSERRASTEGPNGEGRPPRPSQIEP